MVSLRRSAIVLSRSGVLACLLLVLGVFGAPHAVAAGSGPVAAYSFDEGEGGTVEDLTGHGHTATIEGAEWARGRYGDGLEFDGEEGCVSIPASPELQFTEELTLEAWVRPEGAEEEAHPVITQEDPGAGEEEEPYAYELLAGGHEVPKAWIRKAGSGYQGIYGTEPLPEHAWAHIALTDDGAHLRLYVNGALARTTEAVPLTTGSGDLKIGCGTVDGTFQGRIDEVRIYDRVLNAAEVAGDMEAPLQTPRSGPVAAWSFDEGEGTTAGDATGHGHTATIKGATWARGKFGDGLEFDGEEDCVSIPVDEELQATEEFTVEAWVRPEGSGDEALPVIAMDDEGSPPGSEQFSYELFGGQDAPPKGWVRKDGEPGTWGVYGEEPLPERAWSHVTLTDDGNVIRLYVDGKLGKEENSTDVAPLLTAAEGPLTIGCGIQYGAFRHFKGRIDEVRVYDRALVGGEVAADTEAPIQTPKKGPVAAYSFDQGEGEIVDDVTGDGHTATVHGAGWTTHGRYGGAVELDGREGCISIPPSPDLQFSEEFSLEAWVRPEGAEEEAHPVITQDDPEAGAEEEPFVYELLAGESEKPKAWVRKPVSGFQGVYGEAPLPEHAWSHLALTDDGAHIRLYVDGRPVDTEPAPPLGISTEGLKIGCGTVDGTFQGRIDEVRIYNRALNEGEIAADMEAPLQTPKSGPVAAYSFDEGEGTTVHDTTGDGNEGTVEGGAAWVPGKYGDSLRFVEHEGVPTQCVTVADTPRLRLEEEFTLEAWVRPEEWLGSASIISKELESGKGQSYSLGIGFTRYGKIEGYAENQGIYSPEAVEEDRWVHVAYSYDGKLARIYLNGEQVAAREIGAREMASAGPLRIGCDSPEYGARFKGRIDEVRVYDRALNVAEVSSDMESPIQTPRRGPVAAYSFDEGTGSTVGDLTGDGHTATIDEAEWTTRGKYGGAMEFAASKESYLSVPDSPELRFSEEFTLEAWVRPADEEGEYAPLITRQTTGSRVQPYFRLS